MRLSSIRMLVGAAMSSKCGEPDATASTSRPPPTSWLQTASLITASAAVQRIQAVMNEAVFNQDVGGRCDVDAVASGSPHFDAAQHQEAAAGVDVEADARAVLPVEDDVFDNEIGVVDAQHRTGRRNNH